MRSLCKFFVEIEILLMRGRQQEVQKYFCEESEIERDDAYYQL